MAGPAMHEEEIELPSGHMVRLLGISHGDVLRLGRKTREDLRRKLRGHRGCLFAERVSEKFLPREFVSKAVPIEPLAVVGLVVRRLRKSVPFQRIVRAVASAFGRDIQRFVRESLPLVPREAVETSERRFRRLTKTWAGRVLGRRGLGVAAQAMTLRSFLMANSLERHARASAPHPVVLVAGAGHTLQVARFFREERLRERYARHLMSALKRDPELEEAVSDHLSLSYRHR